MLSYHKFLRKSLKALVLILFSATIFSSASPEANYLPIDLSSHFNNDGVASLDDTQDANFDGFKTTRGLFSYDAQYFPSGSAEVGEIPFLLGEKTHGKLNNIICQKQKIFVPPGNYQTILFLGSSVNGSFSAPLSLLYQQDVTETVTLGFTDWCRPESERGDVRAFSFPQRIIRGGSRPETAPNFLWLAAVSANPKRKLAAITLPDLYNLHVFAITLSTRKPPRIAPVPVVRHEAQKAKQNLTITTDRPGNVFHLKEKARLKVFAASKPRALPLKAKLTVYNHDYVPHITKDLKIKRFPFAVKVRPTENGYFPVLLETFDAKGARQDAAWTSLTYMPANKDFSPHPERRVGMNLDLMGKRGELEARLAHNAGVSWVRVAFDWNTLEPRPGEWNWRPLDDVMKRCKRYGFSVLGLLGYWAGWSEPLTQKGFQQYENYVEQVVRRYGDRVHFWEPWNEPNIFYWPGTAEQYAQLLQHCYTAAKRAKPQAQIVGFCAAGTGLDFMRSVLKTNGKPFCDAVSIHPYTAPTPPDKTNVLRDIDEIHKLFMSYGADLPIWITEVGFPDVPLSKGGAPEHGGTSASHTAQDLLKAYVMYGSHPHVERVFWFCFADPPGGAPFPEDRFGIMEGNLAPKPAYYVLRSLSDLLKDVKSVERLPSAKHIYLYNFIKGNEGVVIGWSANKEQFVDLTISAKEGVEGNFYGAERKLKAGAPPAGSGLPVWRVKPEVRYLRYRLH
jgi:hypothetical protein